MQQSIESSNANSGLTSSTASMTGVQFTLYSQKENVGVLMHTQGNSGNTAFLASVLREIIHTFSRALDVHSTAETLNNTSDGKWPEYREMLLNEDDKRREKEAMLRLIASYCSRGGSNLYSEVPQLRQDVERRYPIAQYAQRAQAFYSSCKSNCSLRELEFLSARVMKPLDVRLFNFQCLLFTEEKARVRLSHLTRSRRNTRNGSAIAVSQLLCLWKDLILVLLLSFKHRELLFSRLLIDGAVTGNGGAASENNSSLFDAGSVPRAYFTGGDDDRAIVVGTLRNCDQNNRFRSSIHVRPQLVPFHQHQTLRRNSRLTRSNSMNNTATTVGGSPVSDSIAESFSFGPFSSGDVGVVTDGRHGGGQQRFVLQNPLRGILGALCIQDCPEDRGNEEYFSLFSPHTKSSCVPYLTPELFHYSGTNNCLHCFPDDLWNASVLVLEAALKNFHLADTHLHSRLYAKSTCKDFFSTWEAKMGEQEDTIFSQIIALMQCLPNVKSDDKRAFTLKQAQGFVYSTLTHLYKLLKSSQNHSDSISPRTTTAHTLDKSNGGDGDDEKASAFPSAEVLAEEMLSYLYTTYHQNSEEYRLLLLVLTEGLTPARSERNAHLQGYYNCYQNFVGSSSASNCEFVLSEFYFKFFDIVFSGYKANPNSYPNSASTSFPATPLTGVGSSRKHRGETFATHPSIAHGESSTLNRLQFCKLHPSASTTDDSITELVKKLSARIEQKHGRCGVSTPYMGVMDKERQSFLGRIAMMKVLVECSGTEMKMKKKRGECMDVFLERLLQSQQLGSLFDSGQVASLFLSLGELQSAWAELSKDDNKVSSRSDEVDGVDNGFIRRYINCKRASTRSTADEDDTDADDNVGTKFSYAHYTQMKEIEMKKSRSSKYYEDEVRDLISLYARSSGDGGVNSLTQSLATTFRYSTFLINACSQCSASTSSPRGNHSGSGGSSLLVLAQQMRSFLLGEMERSTQFESGRFIFPASVVPIPYTLRVPIWLSLLSVNTNSASGGISKYYYHELLPFVSSISAPQSHNSISDRANVFNSVVLNEKQLVTDLNRCHNYLFRNDSNRCGKEVIKRVVQCFLLHQQNMHNTRRNKISATDDDDFRSAFESFFLYWQGLDDICAVLYTLLFSHGGGNNDNNKENEVKMFLLLNKLVEKFVLNIDSSSSSSNSSIFSNNNSIVAADCQGDDSEDTDESGAPFDHLRRRNNTHMKKQLRTFRSLLSMCDPLLSSYLYCNSVDNGSTIDAFVSSYIVTLFSHHLEIEKVLILWDFVIFYEYFCEDCLLFVIVAIFIHFRRELMSGTEGYNSSNMCSFLNNICRYLHTKDLLPMMKNALLLMESTPRLCNPGPTARCSDVCGLISAKVLQKYIAAHQRKESGAAGNKCLEYAKRARSFCRQRGVVLIDLRAEAIKDNEDDGGAARRADDEEMIMTALRFSLPAHAEGEHLDETLEQLSVDINIQLHSANLRANTIVDEISSSFSSGDEKARPTRSQVISQLFEQEEKEEEKETASPLVLKTISMPLLVLIGDSNTESGNCLHAVGKSLVQYSNHNVVILEDGYEAFKKQFPEFVIKMN